MPIDLQSQGPLTVTELEQHVDACIREFGQYSFYDKGPVETTDLDVAVRRAKAMPIAELRAVLVELKKKGDPYETFVNSIVGDLEDLPDDQWEELMAGDDLAGY